MTKEEFYKNLKDELGIELTENQKESLLKFANLLIDYNKHTNLTSITELDEIYLKHFYDSLTLSKTIGLHNILDVLDVGSGGGFPGIVLGIVFPNLNITLLDSNHKKTDFQKYAIQELGLHNIFLVNERAEDFYKNGNQYDLVVARAVANLSILSELCIPFVKKNGYFIAMKGNVAEELENAKNAIEFLGGKIDQIDSFSLPISLDNRTLIKILKEKDTPSGYPRTYEKIKKKPIN